MAERTLVGVPFYEGESQECLDATLKNIDQSLNKLAIDASITIQVNGPQTTQGKPPSLEVNKSFYNSDIVIIHSHKKAKLTLLTI